ncbi:phosphoribosyltransferase family protein [Polynucleobacter necessarius]|uniref:phosphoribosyltransferase family protein n=1 Tax=Polynucleobacter necessarius TaxID=576610 RepID=UPI001E307EC2|nr:phosphoribosyltransferase family protein [Polynucleobacter necessarius]
MLKVLLIDDALATGGTLVAADRLIRNASFEASGAITILNGGATKTACATALYSKARLTFLRF